MKELKDIKALIDKVLRRTMPEEQQGPICRPQQTPKTESNATIGSDTAAAEAINSEKQSWSMITSERTRHMTALSRPSRTVDTPRSSHRDTAWSTDKSYVRKACPAQNFMREGNPMIVHKFVRPALPHTNKHFFATQKPSLTYRSKKTRFSSFVTGNRIHGEFR